MKEPSRRLDCPPGNRTSQRASMRTPAGALVTRSHRATLRACQGRPTADCARMYYLRTIRCRTVLNWGPGFSACPFRADRRQLIGQTLNSDGCFGVSGCRVSSHSRELSRANPTISSRPSVAQSVVKESEGSRRVEPASCGITASGPRGADSTRPRVASCANVTDTNRRCNGPTGRILRKGRG